MRFLAVFRQIRVWAEDWRLPWDEWFHTEFEFGYLDVLRTDGERVPLNVIKGTKPSALFENEDLEKAILAALGVGALLPGMFTMIWQVRFRRDD